jgi:hypothetical protein
MNPLDIEGLTNADEIRKLQQWAARYETIVEIGSWKGRSITALCQSCPGTVYAVDDFRGSNKSWDKLFMSDPKENEMDFLKNTKDLKNLKLLKMDSVEAAKMFEPKSIDMVFIDGDHSELEFGKDLDAWLPVCKKFLCGHDLYFGGVQQALDNRKIKYRSVGFNYPLCLWYSEVLQ